MQDESTPATAAGSAAALPVRVLHGTCRKWVWVSIGAAGSVAIGLMPGYRQEHPAAAWAGIVFFGSCALLALVRLLVPAARGTLPLDAQGFIVSTAPATCVASLPPASVRQRGERGLASLSCPGPGLPTDCTMGPCSSFRLGWGAGPS